MNIINKQDVGITNVKISPDLGVHTTMFHVSIPYSGNIGAIYTCYASRLIIIIIIKRGWQCKAGRERLTPYQSEDPNPTAPTHRKKEEKGKTVGVKKGASS